MADSEEFRQKRLKHEEQMSRMFDEVMGLGDFADSSRGSNTSGKSGGQDGAPEELKAAYKTSSQPEEQPVEEEDSSNSRQEEKTNETVGKHDFPRIASGGGGGSGSAAFDDAVDGLPPDDREEEDEDWHFALPLGSLEDNDVSKANRKKIEAAQDKSGTRGKEREEEEHEKEGSNGSANTSHSSQNHTPENSQETDVGATNQAEDTEDSQQGETSEAAPTEDSNPRKSPPVNIKDEPIDDGYDAALLPQSSIRQIKEELEQEEELRISSVYSVGGGNTFVPPTIPAATIQASHQTAIFIPSRGTVLQAVTPLNLRPPVPVPTSISALSPIPPRLPPPPPTVPGSVRCSGCSKVLLKGQTAFQRKGSTQLFCSTVCLTGHLPPAVKNRSCSQCSREIVQPRDMITIPGDGGVFLHFCGQFCLSVFRHKNKTTEKVPNKRLEKRPEKKPEKPPEKPQAEFLPEKPCCSVCRTSNKIEHEVTHQGRLHKLCSDACFATWRVMRQLAMNCCESCGLYCNSNSESCHTLKIDKSQLNFCGPTCIATYKQTCKKPVECAECHKTTIVCHTFMERDQKGKIQLYCSIACVDRSRPPRHVLSDAAFPCSLCKVTAVPQYHLAMVDGTIRNFCSISCVTIYRKSGNTSQPDLTNGTSSLRDPPTRDASKAAPSTVASSVPPPPQDCPSSVSYPGHHPGHTSVPPIVPPYPATSSTSVPGQAQARLPHTRPPKAPEGANITTKLSCQHCSKHFDTKPVLFSHQDEISMFCSRACSELYRKQKNILAVCDSCKQEKVHYDTMCYNQQDVIFCSENCKVTFKREQTCLHKEHSWRPCSYCEGFSPKMLDSHYGGQMEVFCGAHCMSQFTVHYYGMSRCDSCRKQGLLAERIQCLGSVRNFCNISCLLHFCYYHFEMGQQNSVNGTETEPSETPPRAPPTSNIGRKKHDHASTQTERPPRKPHRHQMKNKSVLCRPFTRDQENMCQLSSDSTESGAGEGNIKMVMVPVPVPVYIPVPMSMYSQHTPVALTVPVPVPVPFTVQPHRDMKDAVVQSEPPVVMEDEQRDEPVSRQDQSRSQSKDTPFDVALLREGENTQKGDLSVNPEKKSDTVDSQLHAEKSQTSGYLPASSARSPPPSSPVMDLEADVPSESLDQKMSPLQRGVKRPRDGSASRKRGRRRTASLTHGAKASQPASKLNHLYGVAAWRSWITQQNNKQPEEPSPVDLKEDILQCNSEELSFALSRFIREVRRPNGETYSPDSIFYLCLGIQQYLFMKGRIENIFTDELYARFASEITGMLRLWKPRLLPGGGVVCSRVEESYLWECKQLGAYSPIVLLNTLLFFCTKTFHLTTLEQHQRLSFSNLVSRSKPSRRGQKVNYLQYRRSGSTVPQQTERVKRKQGETNGDLEMLKNISNPLRCPVRLYEFYLSRCPESVKTRDDLFYLQPEQNVHTHSCHWFTCQPLDGATLQNMLTRILAVREAQQEAAGLQSADSTEAHSSL